MKKVQKTLTAALAATLATGIVGSVANAETVNEIYNAAYNATQSALAKKDQVSINEARTAIAKLPAEYKNYASTFSGLVDTVQQPIYVNILSALEKAQKENNQANINAARKMLVGVEQNYANTWSAELDKSQQALIKKAQDACDKAEKSQDAKELAEAKALLADLKTVEGNDAVKTFVEKYEVEFNAKLTIFVEKVEVKNATSLAVTFSREVNKDTVKKENFTIKTGSIKSFAKEVTLSEDNKTVTVELNNKLDEAKQYNLTVRGIKDTKGTAIKETSEDFKYEKKEVKSIELKTAKATRSANLKDSLIVKDAADRDITKESKITFECNEDKTIISKDGKISAAAKIGKEFTIKVTVGDFTSEQKITIVENLAEQLVGFTVGKSVVADTVKYSSITANAKIKTGDTVALTIFYKDALGEEVVLNGAKLKKVESLTKDVVSVTGDKKLTGRKAGTALLRVQYGEIDETIEVVVTNDVVADATLTVDNSSISVSKKNIDKYTTFSVLDNATGKKETSLGGTVQLWDEAKEQWITTDKITASSGVLTVNGSKLSSDVRAKLIVNYQGAKLESEFDVAVNDAGDVTGYELVATKNSKPTTSIDQKDGVEATLSVYALDDNGNRVGKIENTSEVKLFIDGSEEGTILKTNEAKVNPVLFQKADHTFVVKVKKGSDEFTTNTVTLTVKNTDDTKVSSELKDAIKVSTKIADAFNWSYGTTTGAAIVGIDADYVSSDNVNTNNLPENLKKDTAHEINLVLTDGAKDGSVTLFVRSIRVSVDNKVKVIQIDDNRTINIAH